MALKTANNLTKAGVDLFTEEGVGDIFFGIGSRSAKDQLIHVGINAVNTNKGIAIKGWHIGVGNKHVFLNPIKQIKYLIFK